MVFCLIKDGVVVNAIVADQSFVDLIKSQYDFVIQTDDLDPQPGVNWLYDGEEFSPPAE